MGQNTDPSPHTSKCIIRRLGAMLIRCLHTWLARRFPQLSRLSILKALPIVVDRTDQGVALTDAQGRILWINNGFMSICGYGMGEILGRHICEFIHKDHGSDEELGNDNGLHAAMREGRRHGCELINYAKDGREYSIQLAIEPVYNKCGELTHLFFLERDNTFEHLMIDAIRESEERNRSIVETAMDAVILVDSQGMITDWNKQAHTIFGWEPNEVRQQPMVLRVFADQHHAEMLEAFQTLFEGETASVPTGRFEHLMARKSGELFPAEISINTIRNSNGSISLSMFVRDVSERKRAEEALIHAKELAEAASKTKSEFLANMSHEIRTPLNAVIGLTDLLTKTRLDEQQRRYVDLARTSADTLLTLINDVLDFSKIEAGKLEIDLTSVDLSIIMEDVIEMLGPKAASKNIELAVQIAPEARGTVSADGYRFRQVLLNLISNAMKFTDKGHVIARLRTEPIDAENVMMICSVEDTGIGIPAERLDRLFKSFSQVDASSTRKYGGTGLGLAICKQIIEMMGGSIGVKSQEDKGSTFWFKIPLNKPIPASGTPSLPRKLRGLRVLAVDDHAAHRVILQDYLNGWGFKTDVAEDGRHALEMIHAAEESGRPYRLMIVDLVMPNLDGLCLGDELNKAGNTARKILLSGVHQDMTQQLVQSHGFNAFVAKPFRQSQLLDAVVNVMSGLEISSSHEEATCENSPQVAAETPNTRHDIRVLLAEDNEINRLLAMEVLKQAGIAGEAVIDGQKAIEAVKRGCFDVILMDCQMPVLDGFDTTREIRRIESLGTPTRRGGGRIPIVALTANAIKGDKEKCLEAGMDAYLTKPVNSRELIATLREIVLKRHEEEKTHPSVQQPVASSAEPSQDDALNAINAEELIERCMGSVELAGKLLNHFQEEALAELKNITDLAKAGKTQDMAKRIHSLKGTAGNIAAKRLHQIAAEMDRLAKKQDLQSILAHLPEMEREIHTCVEYVKNKKLSG